MSRSRLLLFVAIVLGGCGQTTSYAVPSSADRLPPRVGAVAIFATREPVGTELGVVEARGFGDDAAIDRLIPELSRRAQALGADAIVVDFIGLSVEVVETVALDGQAICGAFGCANAPGHVGEHELVSVRVRGRAFHLADGAAR